MPRFRVTEYQTMTIEAARDTDRSRWATFAGRHTAVRISAPAIRTYDTFDRNGNVRRVTIPERED